MPKLVRSGQVKEGCIIECTYNGEPVKYKAEKILNAGTEHEEVIIDLKKNKYFITKMAINGESWAKDVNIHLESVLFDYL